MKQTALYQLPFTSVRTYLLAIAFLLGGIILPQLLHLIPQGGVQWLPIYFFTLVASYKYGWRVGLITALLTPAVNSLLFGMPRVESLIVITNKAALLAAFAAFAAYRCGRVNVLAIVAVVLGYQLLGTVAEWMISGDLWDALQDFRLGVPGMLMQVFGGYALLKWIVR